MYDHFANMYYYTFLLFRFCMQSFVFVSFLFPSFSLSVLHRFVYISYVDLLFLRSISWFFITYKFLFSFIFYLIIPYLPLHISSFPSHNSCLCLLVSIIVMVIPISLQLSFSFFLLFGRLAKMAAPALPLSQNEHFYAPPWSGKVETTVLTLIHNEIISGQWVIGNTRINHHMLLEIHREIHRIRLCHALATASAVLFLEKYNQWRRRFRMFTFLISHPQVF